jgi:O-antigen/teichoic acid export membrane protein
VKPASPTQESKRSEISLSQWLWRGLLSIVDQGFVSGANFLLVVLFARWLSRPEYGAVSVGLSTFLLAANFHHALLLEPMSVLGPRQFAGRLNSYFSCVVRVHAVAVLLIALAVAVVAVSGVGSTTQPALLGLAASLPLVLSFWVLRRICYVLADPATAIQGGIAFMSGAIVGSVALRVLGWVNAASLFVVTGFAASVAGAVLWRRLRGRLGSRVPLRREVLTAHWSYGRWMVGVSLTYWLANSAFPILLGLGAGLPASAGLRAVENLVTPVLQVTGALSLLVLPWVSGQAHAHGNPYLRRYQRIAMIVAATAVGGYLGCVMLLKEPLMRLLYGPGAYVEVAPLVPVVAIATLIRGISDFSLSTALKGAARPDAHFLASLLSSVFVVTGGWYLIRRWQVAGAAYTMLASNVLQAAVLAVFFARITTTRKVQAHERIL